MISFRRITRSISGSTLAASASSGQPRTSTVPDDAQHPQPSPSTVIEAAEEKIQCKNFSEEPTCTESPKQKRQRRTKRASAPQSRPTNAPVTTQVLDRQSADEPPATPTMSQQQHLTIALTTTGISIPGTTEPALTNRVVLDLGPLISGVVVKRPSASIKSGYVADVQLEDGTVVLAHSPSLDCAGMIVPGATVHMTLIPPKKPSSSPLSQDGGGARPKCTHAIQIAGDPREGGGIALVGCHPQQAEKITHQALQDGLVGEVAGFDALQSQKMFGATRVDYVLQYPGGGRQLLLEVKNVVCADYPADDVPAGRPKVGVYTSAQQPYRRTAIFPHGAHKSAVGVVSDRAIKHVHELTQLHRSGEARCAVMFVVNRGDCAAFRPCHEADMLFAQVLKRAELEGVQVLAHDVDWRGGQALWGKRLPVVFDSSVTGEVDQEHLQRVLHFNATDPRPRWKSAAAGGKKEGGAQRKTDKQTVAKKKGRKALAADSDSDSAE